MPVNHQLRFRAYCDPRHRKTGPFFWVTLWRTIPEARARMLELNFQDKRKISGAAAGCISWEEWRIRPGRKDKLLQEMGEIVLPLSCAGSGTIAHECAHAAQRYLERLADLNRVPKDVEETICLAVGWLTRQIVKRICAFEARRKTAKRKRR